jgi:thiamine pyrophosphate-dependent acetolactate synthase large subunit-like protein
MNNYASGMIRDKEQKTYGVCLHSTWDSGYGMPDLAKLASAYGIAYYDSNDGFDLGSIVSTISEPAIINLHIDEHLPLTPFLPIGRKTQDMEPKLEESRYNYLNNL